VTATARFEAAALEQAARALLAAAGAEDEDARHVASALVAADARGMHSHGVSRLPVYVRRIAAGGARAGVAGTLVKETAATAVLDGEDGIGQVIAMRAMREAIRKARETGAGVVAVRRSNHFGEGAYYVAEAVAEGMIGLITTNGSPNMRYWGGRTSVLGTLPLAVGVPAGEEPPIILDLAFGTVSKGKILQAAARGEKIPTSWAVDRSGRATDDPQAVLDGGWTLPVGAYKGSGLILIMEVLSGPLRRRGPAAGTRPLRPRARRRRVHGARRVPGAHGSADPHDQGFRRPRGDPHARRAGATPRARTPDGRRAPVGGHRR
jgi:LDH2 family malate/lactate/ureidoglycolate dehydrogenase